MIERLSPPHPQHADALHVTAASASGLSGFSKEREWPYQKMMKENKSVKFLPLSHTASSLPNLPKIENRISILFTMALCSVKKTLLDSLAARAGHDPFRLMRYNQKSPGETQVGFCPFLLLPARKAGMLCGYIILQSCLWKSPAKQGRMEVCEAGSLPGSPSSCIFLDQPSC